MQIDRLGPDDLERVLAAPHLFDEPPTAEWTDRFLTADGHHLLFAHLDGVDVGFVTGVEMTHPDKGTEMFLYELGVDDAARGQGVGKALVAALRDLAEERGCYGMWVLTDADNEAALRTYQAAGGSEPDPQVLLDWTFADDRRRSTVRASGDSPAHIRSRSSCFFWSNSAWLIAPRWRRSSSWAICSGIESAAAGGR